MPIKVKTVKVCLKEEQQMTTRRWLSYWEEVMESPLSAEFPHNFFIAEGMPTVPRSMKPTNEKESFFGNFAMEHYPWLKKIKVESRPPYLRGTGVGIAAAMPIPEKAYVCSVRGYKSKDLEVLDRLVSSIPLISIIIVISVERENLRKQPMT